MSRVALIGSCVTRDAWHFLGRLPDPLFFTARTSLVSIMSASLPGHIDPGRFTLESDFQRGCLDYDVNKKTLPALAAFKPDTIILDFIDERFDLLQAGRAFVSYSHEFQLAGGPAMDWAQGGRVIDRLAPEATALWSAAARRFALWLSTAPGLRDARVILHKAPWVTRQVAGDDLTPGTAMESTAKRQQITFGKLVEVAAYARLMDRYYALMQAAMPGIQTVEVPPEYHVGAGQHMWGPSPFHYVTGYYRDFNAKLRRLGVEI